MCIFNQSVHAKVYESNSQPDIGPGALRLSYKLSYRTLLGSTSELIERFHPRDLGLCNLSKQKKSFGLKKVELPQDLSGTIKQPPVALFSVHLVQYDGHGFI